MDNKSHRENHTVGCSPSDLGRRKQKMKGHRKRRAGFTLIELLVVIAIIAILAAILFPVFAQAREKARQAVCSSNLKQIGSAIMMYVQDYGESYPILDYYPSEVPQWYDLINPYIKAQNKNNSIYRCPSLARQGTVLASTGGYGVNYLHVIQYPPEFKWSKSLKWYTARNDGPATPAKLGRPAETIMIADAEAECGTEAGTGWNGIYCPIELPKGPDWYKQFCLDKTYALAKRHNGGGNYLMADGHCTWKRRDAVLSASLEPGKEIWGHYGE
jgi:prepilin-type N-terminal cleavage/methylation domain-containing protein/prepilin-type processing-associated H-X9-DG protein